MQRRLSKSRFDSLKLTSSLSLSIKRVTKENRFRGHIFSVIYVTLTNRNRPNTSARPFWAALCLQDKLTVSAGQRGFLSHLPAVFIVGTERNIPPDVIYVTSRIWPLAAEPPVTGIVDHGNGEHPR